MAYVPHLFDDAGSAEEFLGKPWPTFTGATYAHTWVVETAGPPTLAPGGSRLFPAVEGNPFGPPPWDALVAARAADMLVACASLPLLLLVAATATSWVLHGFLPRGNG
jgi:hypothetical protein